MKFVAIPTAQRPVELQRAVQSFGAHLSCHRQGLPLIVFHTPKSESQQQAVIDALRTATTANSDVRYVGLTEKLAMAKVLKRLSGVDPAVLEFALFHRASQPPAAGANRNAVLLWGAGHRLLSTDDDTLADLHAHPDFDPVAPLLDTVAHGDPSDYFVPDDGDFTSWRLSSGRQPTGGLVGSIESAWAQSAAKGRPAPLAFAGLAGDCGWSAPFGFWGQPLGYLLLNGSTLARLTASAETWARVVQTRRLLRATSRPQLAHGAPGMSTCFGIDATTELPPFLPVGRGQDILFSALVERLQGAPSVWLPIAVAHEPASARRFHGGDLLRAATSLDLCGVFASFLDGSPTDQGVAASGRYLREVAAQSDDCFAQSLLERRRGLQHRLIEDALTRAEHLDLPAYWRNDVERFCERAAAQAESSAVPWIVDVACEDARTSISTARRLVGQYGALCEAWPALWRAARERNASIDDQALRVQASQPRRASVTPGKDMPGLISPYQTWMWRSFLIAPGDAAYITFRPYRGSGPISAELLTRCLVSLADRHEILRCRFVGTDEGDALLDIRPASELVVNQRSAMTPQERVAAREVERTTPIDLKSSLPLRVSLVPTAEEAGGWELWLTIHHIAFDGTSEEIFWRELAIIERNLRSGVAAHQGLTPLRQTFSGIAQRQREQLAAADSVAVEHYWRSLLQNPPEESHSSYRTPSASGDSSALRLRHALPAQLVDPLRELARSQRSSSAAIFLTAWQATVARWSGERDVVVVVDQSTRWDEGDEQCIGLFMSPVPMRADLSLDPRFEELLRRNREAFAQAANWGRIPHERLLKALNLGRRRPDLFGTLFTHLVRCEARQLQGGRLESLELDAEHADYEIGLTVEELADSYSLVLIGNRAQFDCGDLARLAQGVVTALYALCRDPSASVASIAWLSETDRARLAQWNDTTVSFPADRTLVSLLHESAIQHWGATALEVDGTCISFGELWQRAEGLAARLRAAGVGRDQRVGLFVERDAYMLESMLGVLIAGGAYIPLDPAFPGDRLAFMIEDAAPRVLLTTRSRKGSAPPVAPGTTILCVDEPLGAVGPVSDDWQDCAPESLAYVLYTSGSTGRPKGVEITHRSLVNLLCSMAREPGLERTDVLLALTTISGDIAGLELWLPLLVGARIYLAGPQEAGDGSRLAEALLRSQATVLQATPSTWRALFATDWPGNKKLKALVGGEALPLDLAQELVHRCGEAWNVYGPTETTIWSSAWKIPQDVQAVRIGRPIANTKMVVLDENRRSLPLGVVGQLYIGGIGVARGYLGRPELNAERFISDPADPADRLYATGDLARWLPDGTLEFLGRNDEQIKLRGFRLEPGEVEAAILRLPEIERAAVVLHRPNSGDGRLVAYLVAKKGIALPNSADLRVRLRAWLIDTMLPYHFLQVDQLPLTPNGKTDRRRLAAQPLPPGEHEASSTDVASALEAELMDHFTEMLGVPAGLDTDFFEAGGDSLGALRLMARLARARAHELTTGELFLHATPRRMAARLQQLGSTLRSVRHLLTMREGPGRIPVIFVHPIGGHLAPYARLAVHIDSDTPLYGLQAAINSSVSYNSIQDRCAAYTSELVQACPGPVILCGYSLGGVLAMEMAAQLRAAGREVRAVVLLDAGVPQPLPQGVEKLRFRMAELLRFSWSDRRIWLTDQLSRITGTQAKEPDLGEGRPLIDDEEMRKLGRQALDWRPAPYTGKVALFAAERHIRGYSRLPSALGWNRVCHDLEVVRLPCDHRQAVGEPHVVRVAAAIDGMLKPGHDVRVRRG
ncbi:MAG: amino acid adenylation domain-containing protein [Proteobacteria bacterium]|nr:amino acid adenylation domain-containing protein [Pseudomonadota bacterium]